MVTTKNNTNTYINKASFTGTTKDKDGKTKSIPIPTNSQASYTVSNEARQTGSKEGALDRANRTITWKIFVNYMSQDFTKKPFVIDDVLNEVEQELDYDSIVVKEFRVNSNGAKTIIEPAINSSNYNLISKKSDGKDGFVLTFEDGIYKPYVIEFKTNIKRGYLSKIIKIQL